ncbi:hypothetical protein PU560_11280 [Georgenia sp. 10Sc9-8]|uniref:Uncharacterized protein n=1 Tax=Georgenia halotolerans TaxID=3028317 RepID=A0ABT5TYH8_9MICO|nr:hypothetical protein [Georgenia halotolerans]
MTDGVGEAVFAVGVQEAVAGVLELGNEAGEAVRVGVLLFLGGGGVQALAVP